MENPENGVEKVFAYGSSVERLNPFELKVGDYIYVFSITGSIYGFEVTKIDEFNVFVECISGGFEGDSGEIKSKEVCVGERFRFGDNKTSPAKKIIVSEIKLNFEFRKFEYDKDAGIVDSRNLAEGDYIHMVDEEGNYYIVKVSSTDFVAEEVQLQPVLVRYTIRDKLRSRLVGRGLRFSASKLKSLYPIGKLRITRSADEVFEVKSEGIEEEGRKWLSPEVLVSGVSHIYSQTELDALHTLGLGVGNLTYEKLEAAWITFEKRFKELTFSSYSEKVDRNAEYQLVKIGYEYFKKRFKR